MNDIIPEGALSTLEERFGSRFVQHATGRAAPSAEVERKLAGVAIQGSVSRWGEVALLAFDPAEGSKGVVDLSGVTDAELVQLAGRSWMPRRR